MHHYFNTEIAKEVGVNAAVILENIAHWVLKNKANDKNFYDGHYWTYNSRTAMTALFPYLSEKQVRYALDALRKADMVLTGNYNKSSYDRTLWYTVSDSCAKKYFPELLDWPKKANELDGVGQPIPDINTNNKPDNNISHQTDSSASDAPIPAESVRKEKPKSLWDISREITGNDPFTFPYQPTSDSEGNSAAGIVSQGHLVKNLTQYERTVLLNAVYSKCADRGLAFSLKNRDRSVECDCHILTVADAFRLWSETAAYRESAKEAFLSKFLDAWQRLLEMYPDRFWVRSSGREGYVWQNVIKSYAYNWNPGTPKERKVKEAKEALGIESE
nr:MAG TPA: hypothetical protein [Bacteriophage sp.]